MRKNGSDKDFMQLMWRKIIMETDTTLKEKGSVGKHAEWMIALGVEKERATEKRCSILTGTLKYVPPDGGMF
jgi:hypothetical protein